MANKITVRFYEVQKLQPQGPSLKTALETIAAKEHGKRQVQLGEGVVVRLERYSEDAGELEGEFTRVRREDFPYRVMSDGAKALDVEDPLGNGVAFRFRPHDHVLAIQYNALRVSPGRVADYLLQFDSRFAFDLTPKMNTMNWQKFNQFPVRKLKIAIASPQDLAAIENQAAAVRSAASDLGEAYGAPIVTIEMSMGHRKGALSTAVRTVANTFSGLFQGGEADVRTLKASVTSEEGEPAEEINLIDEVLSEKIEFPNPANDPDANYKVRREILKNALNSHV